MNTPPPRPSPVLAALLHALALTSALNTASCQAAPGALEVAWVLADARECGNTAIESVFVSARDTQGRVMAEAVGVCLDPGPGRPIPLGPLDEGLYTVLIETRTRDGALLYTDERLTKVRCDQTTTFTMTLQFIGD